MSKTICAILIAVTLLLAAPAFAVDGQVLINQATVMAAGGFPYNITQPGSYKLSGNLVVPANTVGIYVNANNVTLDLNGFAITGPITCTGYGGGISCGSVDNTYGILYEVYNADNAALTIRNGTVAGFAVGIEADGCLVEDVQAHFNSYYGIMCNSGLIRRSVANYNGKIGISATESTVVENTANFNGEYGLFPTSSLYGSNTFYLNGTPVPSGFGVSQNNNNCDGRVC